MHAEIKPIAILMRIDDVGLTCSIAYLLVFRGQSQSEAVVRV
jgi:hypothetical protein